MRIHYFSVQLMSGHNGELRRMSMLARPYIRRTDYRNNIHKHKVDSGIDDKHDDNQ